MKYMWTRVLYDGIYQIIGISDDDEVIETKRDVNELPLRELWSEVKTEHPDADNYRGLCEAYREGKADREAYFARDQKRYNRYWKR